MAFLNGKEELIIGRFYENIKMYRDKILIVRWKESGIAEAEFYTCFEDENDFEMDDEMYEEYVTFIFKARRISGALPVDVDKNGYFWVDYHNFPDDIIADGKKIN